MRKLVSTIASLLCCVAAATFAWPAPPANAGATSCFGKAATIIGTAGDDQGNQALRGTPGTDVIVGLGGSDTIDGLGGKDYLCGGGGHDGMTGEGGDDHMSGGPGPDTLNGDDGNDVIIGNGGVDAAYGGAGSDSLRLQDYAGGDLASAGTDHDSCYVDVGDVMSSCESKHIRRPA